MLGVWVFGVFGIWVFGVWMLGVFGVWVLGVWVFGVFGIWVFRVWMFGKQLCITCRYIKVWGGGFPGLKLGTANSVYVPLSFPLLPYSRGRGSLVSFFTMGHYDNL